jgi:hypothetical protein
MGLCCTPAMGIAFGRSNPMPRDTRLARRDRTASAVSARVCVLHPSETTAPDPHSKTPLEAPLVDRGADIILQDFRAGITFFREVIPAMWKRDSRPAFPRPAQRGEGGIRAQRG